MNEHETIAGNVYCVTCAEGCTVTDSSGQLNEECEAGKQLYITAPSGVLFTSAPATVRKVNFNNAPVKLKLLGLLGGGVSTGLPSGYLAAEFLESTGTQWIDTGLIATESTEFEAEAAIMSTNGAVLGQNNVNYQSGYYCVRANGNLYMRAGSQEFSFGTQYASGEKTIFFKKDGKIGFGNISQNLSAESYTGKASLFLFARRSNSNGVDYAGTTRFWHINMADNGKEYKLVATIDKNGTPCMFDKVSKKPFRNSGTGSFIVGMTLKQARKLGKLPDGGGTLKVSLPSNYLEDEGVTNAIAAANAKGWNIEVASTFEADGASATFALRRIWVRKTQDEQGNYIDSDGVRWMVESCVAMYNADGSEPDAHGYEPFRSVEVATEHWGLTEWVDPEAEEELFTNTEEV